MPRQSGHQGGGSSLSMRSRDRNAILPSHQFRQHLSPGNDGDLPAPGLLDFRIVRLDRRGHDHHVRGIQVPRGVASMDAGAPFNQPFGH